jgi:lipopolysaccharide export LptBFGC system permease protein LptF
MPWLLYRYIALELLRTIGLTTAVLVTVIAFGALIKPLANETLLDAGQTFKYLLLAIVPMLQYALPFSAGFGATLTFHRMTADNEMVAMAASGLSYRRIVVPLVVLGLTLSLFMVGLTQWIAPQFWALIERTVTRDITKMFQTSIEKGVPFEIPGGDLQIMADRIIVESQPDDSAATTRMRLYRVAALELDNQRRAVTVVTASQAVVDIHRLDGRTYLKLAMLDAVAFKPGSGELIMLPTVNPDRAFAVPSPLVESPKTMTRTQLMHLRANPDDFAGVMRARAELRESLRLAQARRDVNRQLSETGQVRFVQGGPDGLEFVVHADELSRDRFVSRGGRGVDIVQYDGESAVLRFRPRIVRVAENIGGPFEDMTFDLRLESLEVIDLRAGGTTNQRAGLDLAGLTLAQTPADVQDAGWIDLVLRAEEFRSDEPGLVHRIDELRKAVVA